MRIVWALLVLGCTAPDTVAVNTAVQSDPVRVIVALKRPQEPKRLRHAMPRLTPAEFASARAAVVAQSKRYHFDLPAIDAVVLEVAGKNLNALEASDRVAYVVPDERDAIEETPTWNITRVTADQAWLQGASGQGVKIGILDSGGDIDHPDLGFAGGYNAVTSIAGDWDDDLAGCNGHGTHVAGIAAARNNGLGVVGVAPQAQLYAIKVFQYFSDMPCGSYQSTQMRGIQWAADSGIRVVNASLGGPTFNSAYQDLVSSITSRGVYLVVSAGNNNTSALQYPAAYVGALGVSALTSSNTKASYSNYGSYVYIAAPGDGIYSTLPGGTYGSKSGTSMAAPHVVGVLAVLLSQFPVASREVILAKLRGGALDLDLPGRDDLYGYGLVRAAEALQVQVNEPVVLAASNTGNTVTVQEGTGGTYRDSSRITLQNGTGTWTAVSAGTVLNVLNAPGTSGSYLVWQLVATGLPVGTHVGTITVSSAQTSNSVTIRDTLVVKAKKRKGGR